MKIVCIAALVAALSTSAAFAAMPPLSGEAIDSATFEDWQARQRSGPPVARVVTPTGNDEAVEGARIEDARVVQVALDAAELSTSGAPDAVALGLTFSADLPSKTSARFAADPVVPEQAEQMAEVSQDSPDPFLTRLQILLDRAHVSPGVIDGLLGENTRKAVAAYEEMHGLPVDGELDADVWTVLAVDSGGSMQTYEITAEDVDGPFLASMPDDYAELAELEWLGYRDVVEMLAEKFHIDGDLLKLLNPEADFSVAGTTILVPATGPEPAAKAARIVVNKAAGELRAYDASGALVLTSPATLGSADSPSPAGTLTVSAIAPEPTYSYDPEANFQQGENREPLTLPPGPNGPVGSMWIDLSEPTFGIHGTPDPAMIDKSQSHGCVRLTNWDATTLAALVVPGSTIVEFQD